MLVAGLLLASLSLAVALWWEELARPRALLLGALGFQAPPLPQPPASSGLTSPATVAEAFVRHLSYVRLAFTARVLRDLPPLGGNPRRRRYLLRCQDGARVEVLSEAGEQLRAGEAIAVLGTYVWTGRGGLVYETQPPRGELRRLEPEAPASGGAGGADGFISHRVASSRRELPDAVL
jgi:hypothetical protein